jgi:hypothetical protein
VDEVIFDKTGELEEDTTSNLRKWLEDLSPEEMGRYEM